MSTAASLNLRMGFSKPGVHAITYRDDFCSYAREMRDELLRFSNWREMTQGGVGTHGVFSPDRQNGITTGHLGDQHRDRLPHCMRFRDYVAQNLDVLCPLVDVNPKDARDVEINAMAYGAGAWLSPHTDFFEYGGAKTRLAAWMFYLTAPEDGEWPPEKGGSVRVWTPGSEGERIPPRFNRFAMFRVHNNSFHEIEKVTWEPEWPNCRLALSGWVLGESTDKVERNTRVYLQSAAFIQKRREVESTLQGGLALYRLLAKQKKSCGDETAWADDQISEYERDYQAHQDAPPGTSFLHRITGPAGCIIVVDDSGDTIHLGTAESFLAQSQKRRE